MRAPEFPMYALVLWPDGEGSLGCISLDAVPDAKRRRALVIAREDDVLNERVSIDLTALQMNPRRVVDDE